MYSDFYVGDRPSPVPMHDLSKFSPHMDYCGRVRRYVPYKDKVRRDKYFHEFVKTGAITFEEKYKMAIPNRQAMTLSISKYNRPQPGELDLGVWAIAQDWAEKHFGRFVQNTRVVDWSKARNELDRVTSAGYPWSLWFANKGVFLDSEESLKVEDALWQSLTTDSPIKCFWTASLKRELRPVEKLVENKIRTFTASPTELSVATTRLCLDFNEQFYASNNKTWSFVGCSKYNRGWHKLYERLRVHKSAFELDESAFDASLFRAAMESARNVRWNLMHSMDKTEDNKKRLWEVYNQIVHSYIVLDTGEVVQKHTGNPSGSANTIVDNTLILFMLLAYAWIFVAMEQKDTEQYASYACFMEHVEAALNGDDNTFTVSDKVVEWFNAKAVARVWSKIGVETKSPCYDPRPLDKVSFLSHDFMKYNDTWVPVCEREKALCSLMWGSELDDVRFTLLRACALRMETWTDVRCRRDIKMFIDWLRKNYAAELVGSIPDTQITMKIVDSVYKTDNEIERLYIYPAVLESVQSVLCECVLDVYDESALKIDVPKECIPAIGEVPVGYVEPPVNKWRGKSVRKCFDYEKSDTEMYIPSQMPKSGAEHKNKGGGNSLPKHEKRRREEQSRRDKAAAGRNRTVAKRGGRQPYRGRGGNRGPARQPGRQNERPVGEPLARSEKITNKVSFSQPLRRREFLGSYTSGSDTKTFEVKDTFALNPGLQKTLPWGFAISNQYEKHMPRGITFVWEPRCPDTTPGAVLLCCDYDSHDGAFSTYVQAANAMGSIENSPYKKIRFPCDTRSMKTVKQMIVRNNTPSGSYDIRLYDGGLFYLIFLNEAGSAAPIVGDLWIEYDWHLEVPVGAQNAAPSMVAWDHTDFKYSSGASTWFQQTTAGQGFFRSRYTVVGAAGTGALAFAFTSAPPGQYMLTIVGTAASATLATQVIGGATGVFGVSVLNVFGAPGVTYAETYNVVQTGGTSPPTAVQHIYTFNLGSSGSGSFSIPTTNFLNNDYCDVILTFMGYPAGNGITFGRKGPIEEKKTVIPKTLKEEFIDALRAVKDSIRDDGYVRASEPPSPDVPMAKDGVKLSSPPLGKDEKDPPKKKSGK